MDPMGIKTIQQNPIILLKKNNSDFLGGEHPQHEATKPQKDRLHVLEGR